jgi:hypothetical protein
MNMTATTPIMSGLPRPADTPAPNPAEPASGTHTGHAIPSAALVHFRNPPVPEDAMTKPIARDLLLEAADHLPRDASLEEAMERVLFLAKIEQGKADLEAGRFVDHDDVKRRLLD